MSGRTKGHRVVITGASSGIGAATAEGFAKKGARLVLASRNPAALETVAVRCRTLGGEVLTVPMPRPRRRLELVEDKDYVHCRAEVLEFLYARHAKPALAA